MTPWQNFNLESLIVILGDRDRNLMQKPVTTYWFPSRKSLRPLSEFDKAEKWQPVRSGFLTSSGKSSIPYTSLFSKKFACRIWLQITTHTAQHAKAGKNRFSITARSQSHWIHTKPPMDFSRLWRMPQGLVLAPLLISEVLHALEKTPISILVRGIYFPLLVCHSKVWITKDMTLT